MKLRVGGLLFLLAAGAVLYMKMRRPPERPPAPPSLTFPMASATPTPLRSVRAFPGLTFRRPVFLTAAPGSPHLLFVVEQDGRVLRFENRDDVASADVFLDIRPRVTRLDMEEGLLGLAFAPDYAESRTFYVYYSAAGPRRTVLARFRAGEDGRADPATHEALLEIPQPYGNHNGGMIAFGPDGMLYAGVGDGGAGGDPHDNAQNLETLLGSILRIDPGSGDGYAVPPDNPFVAAGGGARGEIWAYGLRNPWRFSFDSEGRLWAGDVGQDRLEEIDIVSKGGNYGWNVMEGSERLSGWRVWKGLGAGELIPPVHEYRHDPRGSVTGGYVYRGGSVPWLVGAYVYGDFVSGQVWALVHGASNREVARVPSLASFGEDARGELYAVSLGGAVFRFAERPADEPAAPFPRRLSETGLFLDTPGLRPGPGLHPYRVRVPAWADGADVSRWMALPAGGRIGYRADGAWTFPPGTAFVQHFEAGAERIETRLLLRQAEGWGAYTYRWNTEGTDAVLLDERQTATVAGRPWSFPGRVDCLTCHGEAAGWVLGVRTRQVREIADWQENGLFAGPAAGRSEFPALDDERVPLARRARAYLAVNCAPCHQPGASAPSNMDLRFETALDAMRVVGEAPRERREDLGPWIVKPGSPEESALWRSMRPGPKRMPPLGPSLEDERGLALVRDWIAGLR